VPEQAGQSIPGGPFVAPGVRERIYDHVFSSLDAEVGGVLVGRLRDDGSPRITDMIPALEADGARSRVTFTHEAWSTIHTTLDRDYPGEEILGWYHSHPGFGIFLSEHDLFIHRNFFGRAEQIAIVVDPHAGSEGLFVWREGEVVKAGEEPTLRPGELPEELERALPVPELGPARGALAFYWVLGMAIGVLAWVTLINTGDSSHAEMRQPAHSHRPAAARPAATAQREQSQPGGR
jgi:proteasome lid subunit RPN8/RPN11